MTLIEEIKSNRRLRKIFGERELKIIEKQLLGVNLTQSEKNRLSRDIREKLKAIKTLSKYEETFDLKKGTEIKRLIELSKEIILESEKSNLIKEIVLFGSTLNNERTLRSDIDIALVMKENKISKKELTKFRAQLLGKLPEVVDLQIYSLLPEKIKKEIKKEGKTIYGK